MMEIEKFELAKIQIIINHPFFASLFLQMRVRKIPCLVVRNNRVKAATDGESLYLDVELLRNTPLSQLMGILLHEILHASLGHSWRRNDRDPELWNMAADYVVNGMILEYAERQSSKEKKIELPGNYLFSPTFENMSVEEVYLALAKQKNKQKRSENDLIEKPLPRQPGEESDQTQKSEGDREDEQGKENKDKKGEKESNETGEGKHDAEKENEPEPSDNKGSDGNDDNGESDDVSNQDDDRNSSEWPNNDDGYIEPDDPENEERTEKEKERLELDWKMRVAEAAIAAQTAGKLPGWASRIVDNMLNPVLPWQVLLAGLCDELMEGDYDMSSVDRRFVGDDIYLPDLGQEDGGSVVIALDTSGSISEEDLKDFAQEAHGILKTKNINKIRLIGCDADISFDKDFDKTEYLDGIDLGGGGGTDFTPVFDLMLKEKEQKKLLIYFTDLEGRFPEETSFPFSVLWVHKGYDHKKAPFGITIEWEDYAKAKE